MRSAQLAQPGADVITDAFAHGHGAQLVDCFALQTHRAWSLVRLAERGREHPRTLQAWLQCTFRLAIALQTSARCEEAEEVLREAHDKTMTILGSPNAPFGLRVVAHEAMPWIATELVEHLRAHGRLSEAQLVADSLTEITNTFRVAGGEA